MSASHLSVAVLWHMHQPDYVDGATGRPRMPWVRLHALHSYADVVRIARETPDTRIVLNVVPSLLRQLEAAAAGVSDPFLDLARPHPRELTNDQKLLLLKDFFSFHMGRVFPVLPRLQELWERLDCPRRDVPAERLERFDDQDLLDLQTGFHLAWCGPALRRDALVRRLEAQGRGWSQQDKLELLERQHRALGEVLAEWRSAAADPAVELSCTPLNHPILPLLCDSGAFLEAVPDGRLPEPPFRRSGDAWYHVRTALDETERVLGVRPRGMWPAEGSVSEDALRVFQTENLRWVATDQGVLERSCALGGQDPEPVRHFQPWRWGGDGAPAVFFRDTGLSDAVGFRFQDRDPVEAMDELIGHLETIRRSLPAAGEFLCPLILDGENAWEAYPGSGEAFLREFYGRIAAHPNLRWRTFSEHLDRGGSLGLLSRLRAGSWIRADFTTWMGHPQKTRGWELLAAARNDFEEALKAGGAVRKVVLADGRAVPAPDPDLVGPGCDGDLARAMAAMADAESSDWFWWYGDDNPTEYGREFDDLFRGHLRNAAVLAGLEPLPETAEPVPYDGGRR